MHVSDPDFFADPDPDLKNPDPDPSLCGLNFSKSTMIPIVKNKILNFHMKPSMFYMFSKYKVFLTLY